MQASPGTLEELRLLQERQRLELDSLHLRHREEILAFQLQRRLFLERTRLTPQAEKQAMAADIAQVGKCCDMPPATAPEQPRVFTTTRTSHNSIPEFVSASEGQILSVNPSGEPNISPTNTETLQPAVEIKSRFIVTRVPEDSLEALSAQAPAASETQRAGSQQEVVVLTSSQQQLYELVPAPTLNSGIPSVQQNGGSYNTTQSSPAQQSEQWPQVRLVYRQQQLSPKPPAPGPAPGSDNQPAEQHGEATSEEKTAS